MPVYQVLKGLLAGAAALTLAVTGVTTASAAQPVLVNRAFYAAVGDSFAAGVGNPTLRGAGASLRSADAYPVLLAGKANKVTFLAASGATTATVLAQVAYVPGGARQITVTVGGNDIGFVSLAIGCARGLQTAPCPEALAAAYGGLGLLTGNLAAVIAALHVQAPAAHIYVTGYPLLFQPQVSGGIPSCPALSPYDAAALTVADGLTLTLNNYIQGAVSIANATGSVVTYVDVTAAFGGHGLCDGLASYIFPPTLDQTGQPVPSSLHPTPAGQLAYAEAIADAGFHTTALKG
jgi:lysophospholipase L1-like esterase